MSKDEKIVFCTGGGCTAKLGAGVLSRILEKLPRGEKDPNLLVGYDSRDDAAVYRVTEDLALVQTVDFFPPMVDDPYTFGQIAAANALSDVYAMGGEVKTALNLVCFPENMDLNVLGEILRGGAEKVAEAGGILAGGHSIADTGVKYGLSVTGLVDPHHLYANDAGQPGDKLLLTKALGVGLLCTANRVGEAAPEHMAAAIRSMTTLNKTAAEISRRYTVHAATDVTGFSFLGHLHEMMGGKLSCKINARAVPVLPGAEKAARFHSFDVCLTSGVLTYSMALSRSMVWAACSTHSSAATCTFPKMVFSAVAPSLRLACNSCKGSLTSSARSLRSTFHLSNSTERSSSICSPGLNLSVRCNTR